MGVRSDLKFGSRQILYDIETEKGPLDEADKESSEEVKRWHGCTYVRPIPHVRRVLHVQWD
jgi:hypothetical protein